MHVEAIGHAKQASDLKAGDCFFFDERKKSTFAIRTAEKHGHMASIVFSREGERTPMAIVGGLPSTVLVVRGAQIRTEPTSLAFSSSIPLGDILVVENRFYVAAAFRRIEVVTVNLQTGLTEDVPSTGAYVHFSRWSVGIPDGQRWIPVFDFPLSAHTQPEAAR
ncbi:hypothetical protein OZ411_01480 [Bradyrhizobium sp. Arg237L]|uniref:hypothetical protein n=1 Tax=Bradyrhizobium sp. Arg237L TaxID=3003352 RepID=UPI00249F6C12|nr:hypothetical protein [Bradyrhizobium sp. Arg237L]MDI4231484.1 hypothetical protein [Bradyrhizobium sp. Arg237L]